MKIYLIDNACNMKSGETLGSHSYAYCKTINEIKESVIYDNPCEFEQSKKHIYNYIKDREKYFSAFWGKDYIHLLAIDYFYQAPSVLKKLNSRGTKIIATLHHYPKTILAKMLLKISSNYIEYIVVHTEYIKIQLNDLGIKNVVVINYPAFFNIENEPDINSKSEYFEFLSIGGTRYSKGSDILADSFEYLDPIVKDNIRFNFVGKEEDIKYSYIKNKANTNNVNILIDDNVVTNEKYWEYIYNANAIILPYRKIFTGSSGPMTDGVYAKKHIVGPESGNLGYLINKNNLGVTFQTEDPLSLAKAIKNIVLNTKEWSEISEIYRSSLDKKVFVKAYEKLYQKLRKTMD